MEIAGLRGQFTVTIEYNGRQVKPVQITPATSYGYLSHIAREFPKLTADGMGKFPDFKHGITLTDDAIPLARPVRQVPITCCAAVEKEVEQMVTDAIWE
uniref:Uncharacterized protein n=1 Tax=Romanomermis culicivorax TaxID=13658 RepID=A0A915ITT7_ROMCU